MISACFRTSEIFKGRVSQNGLRCTNPFTSCRRISGICSPKRARYVSISDARCPDSSAPMSSNSFAVAGYVSRRPSAKSAYTRPSSSSSEIASARISRSVKSLKFRAMPTSLLFLDSVSRIGFRETLIKLVPDSFGPACQPGNCCLPSPARFAHPPPHRAISPSAILRNRRKTLQHFLRTLPLAKWNRACSNTARFTRNFAGYERQSSASEFPAERLQTLHRGTSMSISAILNSSSNQYQIGAASNPHQQKMQQLGQALQSGNLSATQSDFATLRAAFSQPATATGSTSNPVAQSCNHLSSGGGSGDSSNQNSLLQDLNQIGQSLPSSNLAGAQQAYATLQQQLQQFALGSADSSQLSNMPLSLVA